MDHEIILLADPKGKVWEFTKKVYERIQELENALLYDPKRCYSLGGVEIIKFNDGEIFTRIDKSVRGNTCFYFHDSSLDPQDWLVSLLFVNDALRRSDAEKITDVLPYMKYSRQDRMADPRTPISAGVAARAIEVAKVKRVITTDLHNPATAGAYDIPFENLKAYPVLIDHLKTNYADFLKDAVIVAPDVGGAQRANSYAKRLGLNVAIAHKSREKAGVVGEMKIIGDIKDKNILIVDDMIDTAGTLCKAADILCQEGAKEVYACATHGILSKDARQKIEDSCLKKVIITDSIPQESNGKIEVVSLKNLFADVIYRIAHKKSVSELYV